jgi:hypothetical protein
MNCPLRAKVLPTICCLSAMHLEVNVQLTYPYAITWTHSEYRSLVEASVVPTHATKAYRNKEL